MTHTSTAENRPDTGSSGPPDRFAFGRNWANFTRRLAPARIEEAERSLRAMLQTDGLSGRSFLDVGPPDGRWAVERRSTSSAGPPDA